MRAVTALLLFGAAAPALAADDPYRLKLLFGGGYEVGSPSFDQTVSLEQFAETATIATTYGADSAPGFDLAVQFNAFKHVGFSLAGTLYQRDLGVEFEASFPHPLYFSQPRSATGTVSGQKMKERAGHASIVVYGKSGSLDISGWAGVSLFKVEVDLLTNVTYSHAYPYDSVSVTSTPVTRASDQPASTSARAWTGASRRPWASGSKAAFRRPRRSSRCRTPLRARWTRADSRRVPESVSTSEGQST